MNDANSDPDLIKKVIYGYMVMTSKPKFNRGSGRAQESKGQTKKKSLRELKRTKKSAYQNCFEDWQKRWHKSITFERAYFKGDKIEIDE